MRFFSFPEIQTDSVSLVLPGHSADLQEILPGQTYYLAKDRFVETVGGKVQKERSSTLSDPDLMSVTYEIDPGVSLIKDEHANLA